MRIKMTLPQTEGNVRPVWFEFGDAQAHGVAVSGDFGPPYLTPVQMAPMGPGRWLRVLFLKPGRYQYCFLADGRRVLDPKAGESATDAEGKANSVVVVKPIARTREPLAVAA